MKRAYHFAALILLTCSAACNNSTNNGNPYNSATENKAKDNTSTANQPEGLTLMSKSDCINCHKQDTKLVGPALKDIAAKYPNTPENISMLTDKVLKGGTGVWGNVPMVPHTTLQKPDVEKMVGYILSLGEKK